MGEFLIAVPKGYQPNYPSYQHSYYGGARQYLPTPGYLNQNSSQPPYQYISYGHPNIIYSPPPLPEFADYPDYVNYPITIHRRVNPSNQNIEDQLNYSQNNSPNRAQSSSQSLRLPMDQVPRILYPFTLRAMRCDDEKIDFSPSRGRARPEKVDDNLIEHLKNPRVTLKNYAKDHSHLFNTAYRGLLNYDYKSGKHFVKEMS